MPHLCLDCFNTYKSDLMQKADKLKYTEEDTWVMCPNTKCNGNVIEVDELILPTIKLLNQKGYHTKFCCSGHTYDKIVNCYIMFDNEIDIPSVPKGFSKDFGGINESNICVEANVTSINYTEYQAYKFILKANTELLKWARSLPNNSLKNNKI